MKKLLIITILFLTGCSSSFLSRDFETAINQTLSLNHRANFVTRGYKLYLPPDVRIINNFNNNLVLYTRGTKLFMYTDLISYYHKHQADFEYDVKDDVYFSKALDYNGKLGYIEIREDQGKYYIQVMYNYAKIEAIVSRANLEDVVLRSIKILRNIVYNQTAIGVMISNQAIGRGGEETFQLFPPRATQSEFLQYAEQYDRFEGEYEIDENPTFFDPDQIDLTDVLETNNE